MLFKDEKFTEKISTSGSLALDNVKGVISARMTRPVYNLDELKRTIDTEITELSQDEEEQTVLLSIYNDALRQIDELNTEIERLGDESSKYQTEIIQLESENSTFKNQIDSKDNKISNLENQLETANKQITDLTKQFQNIINGTDGLTGDIEDNNDDIGEKIVPNIDIFISIDETADEVYHFDFYDIKITSNLLNIDMVDVKEYGIIYGNNENITIQNNEGLMDNVNHINNQFYKEYTIPSTISAIWVRGYAISKEGKIGYSKSRLIEPPK